MLPTVVFGRKSPAEFSAAGIQLRRERVEHSVHSSPCVLHHTVCDVLGGNRRIFRYVPRRADRPSLKAANANPQRENTENNAFMVRTFRGRLGECAYRDSQLAS